MVGHSHFHPKHKSMNTIWMYGLTTLPAMTPRYGSAIGWKTGYSGPMRFIRFGSALVCWFLWSLGWDAFGKRLFRYLGDSNFDLRVVVGMLLVRSGHKSLPLLRQGLQSAKYPGILIQIMADIGDPGSADAIVPFCESEDLELRRTAMDALRQLNSFRKS